MHSIRQQLLREILGGAFALLLLAGAILGFVTHRRVVQEFDRALEAKARALMTLTARDGRRIDVDFRKESMPEFEAEDPEDEKEEEDQGTEPEDEELEYFQIFLDGHGAVVARAPSLQGKDLPLKRETPKGAAFRNWRLPDGRRGRVVQITFQPRVDPPDPAEVEKAIDPEDIVFELPPAVDERATRLVLLVARSREALDALLRSLYFTLGGLAALLLAGIGLLVRRSIRRGFAPIDAINTQIRQIGPETLDGRLTLASAPEELATILAALNGLLERVERGFARERHFSSDVAHELRTPVAELRTACEVGAKWPDDPAAVQHLFSDIREVALQMERVVTSLLTLTRCDSGTVTIERKALRLDLLVQKCWQHAESVAVKKGLRFVSAIDPAVTAETDRDKLEMIVQNLIDNAVAHSLQATLITCESGIADTGVYLTFANTPANLEPADLANICDRFWQKDKARTDQSHSGLGLSIVKALCDLLAIGLAVDLEESGLFEVRLSFAAERRRDPARGERFPEVIPGR